MIHMNALTSLSFLSALKKQLEQFEKRNPKRKTASGQNSTQKAHLPRFAFSGAGRKKC